MDGHGAHEIQCEYSIVQMNNKITLQTIALAIHKNCVVDKMAERPLTLKKYSGGNKNKSIGRLLFIHFADQAGISIQDVMNYLGMDSLEYEKRYEKMKEYMRTGKALFDERSTDEEPALFFYRKLRIIDSALHSPL
jgi:hypothetical protein